MPRDPMYPSLLPYSPERDVYRLLQVDPNANNDEIAAACRRLARTFHPDRNRSSRAHEEMQVVNAVRHLLTDPRSRAAYDGAVPAAKVAEAIKKYAIKADKINPLYA